MTFTDIMIDLETLSNKPNGAVVAVGAVFFNPNSGELGEKFEMAIDMADAVRYGQVDGDTLKWWFSQSDGARKAITRGRHTAEQVWSKFYDFVLTHGDKVHPWGNGSSFDITMCQYQFARVLSKGEPWKFWNIQDCRTIKRAADGIVNYTDKLEGVAHSALADAIHQAKYVSAYWQGLRAPLTGRAAAVNKIADSSADDFDLDLDLD